MGMGMGLPICRSIMEAHDGLIRADNWSALGGARFSLALPAVREVAASEPQSRFFKMPMLFTRRVVVASMATEMPS